MKRLLIFLLCLILPLCGCAANQPRLDDPITFYYPRTEYVFGQPDSVIASECREGAGKTASLSALLNYYLQGPASSDLQNPFPTGTKIIEIRQDSTVLQLVMNDRFSQLSGMELTVACACLAKTGLSLSDCQTVQIILDDPDSDTQRIITMDNQSLLLMDDIITTPTETQEGL